MNLKKHRHLLWGLFYGGLAAVIMGPLLLPGYILTLDMVFVPHMPFPAELTNTYVLDIVLWAISSVVPGDVVQKIVLMAMFFACGVGGYSLVKHINPQNHTLAPHFAGVFYMVNPFVYSRFMAGQWLVLLGYALLPFFIKALLQLFAAPGRKTTLTAGMWLGGLGLVSVHMLGVGLTALIVAASIAAWQSRKDMRHLKKTAAWTAVCVGVAIALNSFWLIPSLLGHTTVAQAAASFSDSQFATFATGTNTPLGAIGNVIMLQGFWLDNYSLYTSAQNNLPVWIVLWIVIWALIAFGIKTGRTAYPFFTWLAAGLIAAGLLVAATPLVDWLRHIIPFIGGYREPHKFAALVALGFAMLGTLGVVALANAAARVWSKRLARYFAIGIILAPCMLTWVMLWGFSGQLKASEYPADWHAMNQQLNTLATDGTVLFLPWHQYMVFGFTSRIIATPADKFFDRPIIVSDNPEVNDVPPTLPDHFKQKVQAALFEPDAATRLSVLGIRYILMAKEYDFGSYAIRQSPSLRLLTDNDSFELYEVNTKGNP